ncbi:MAG TPA: hypothetical protein VGS06_29015 [Streptosporangiaceae bacterium]|nr:hypothetical protein [Streptosporangiaceae bacterium]
MPPWPDWMDDPAAWTDDLDLFQEDAEDAPPPDVDEAELASEAAEG